MILEHKNLITEPDGTRIDINDISLETLGMHIIFGEIDTNTMKDAISFVLKANTLYDTPISLILNTVGGSTSDGFALVDLMSMSKIPVHTVGVGDIMSMGVLILSAGTKGQRTITRNATVMAHQFTNTIEGKFHEIESSYSSMVRLKNKFIQHFKRHSTMTDKQINDIVFGPTDRYLTAAECKKFGLVDEIIDELPNFLPQAAHSPKQKSSRRVQK
jgi:ATP-dependent Clp endopeptidase proteolytic subunit ClpP